MLSKAYLDDEAAANAEYKEQTFRLTGSVNSVQKESRGSYAKLKGARPAANVLAHISDEHAAKLSPGDRVDLICVGAGAKAPHVLLDCQTESEAGASLAPHVERQTVQWIENGVVPQWGKLDAVKSTVVFGYTLGLMLADLPACQESLKTKQCVARMRSPAALERISPEQRQVAKAGGQALADALGISWSQVKAVMGRRR